MFKLDASYSSIIASCVMDLDLKVKAFSETTYRCSSLGCRVRVDRMGWDCELEISKILLTRRNPKFLRGCKRPGEMSRISV